MRGPRPAAETSTVTTTVSTNGQTKPTTKTTTVKTTKTAPRQQNTRQVRNFVRRELQKRTDGPKAAITQTATLTLGTLGTNGSGNLEIEGVAHLNPLLIKEKTAAAGAGPIQALASQYAMWRCLSLRVVLVPTVGASAVSGTVARTSLNQPGAPAQTTWSGLGARKHVDAKALAMVGGIPIPPTGSRTLQVPPLRFTLMARRFLPSKQRLGLVSSGLWSSAPLGSLQTGI